MTSNETSPPPSHIAALLQSTPSGVAKLVAAWDALSFETQIFILHRLREMPLSEELTAIALGKAFESHNPYVRYLAAKGLYPSLKGGDGRKEDVKRRVEEDADPLVRYCLLEKERLCDILDDPNAFWALPHAARLALVRCLWGFHEGERVARLVSFALAHRKEFVTGSEVYDVLADFTGSSEFKGFYAGAFMYGGEFDAQKDLETLWRLVLELPEAISLLLIERLPAGLGAAGRAPIRNCLPEEVLTKLNHRQLETLFYRPDVTASDLRKAKFLGAGEKDFMLRGAAASYNLNLSYDDFSRVLRNPEKQRTELLFALSQASGLDLCFYEAIHDAVDKLSIEFWNPYMGSTSDRSEMLLSKLGEWERVRQVRELSLYELARKVATTPYQDPEEGPHKYTLPDDLGFLAGIAIKDDVWSTFVAFSRAWADRKCDACEKRKLERHLPCVVATKEEHESEEGNSALESIRAAMERLEHHVEEAKAAIDASGILKDDPLGTLSRTVATLTKQLNDLHTIQRRNIMLLYIAIGLLLFGLISRW